MPEAPRGEGAIVERIRQRDPEGWIGDDVTFLPDLHRPVVTVDQQIEGVHFVPDLDPAIVARRLVAVNLSDLAAAGARPRFGWLALAAPSGYPIDAFLDAILDECERRGFHLAGGDLASAPQLAASLTLMGALEPDSQELRRSRAQPGDVIWIGGELGASALGRSLLLAGARPGPAGSLPASATAHAAEARRCIACHLEPEPQLELGGWLASIARAAAIDVSDGLSLDLSRLAAASGVDAEIDLPEEERGEFSALARALDLSPTDLVLHGGEDYVLLFTLSEGVRPPERFAARPIGRTAATGDRGGRLFRADGGRREEIPPLGWDHFTPHRTPFGSSGDR